MQFATIELDMSRFCANLRLREGSTDCVVADVRPFAGLPGPLAGRFTVTLLKLCR